MNANMWSKDAGNLCRSNYRNEWTPWRHILAGIAYLGASLQSAGLLRCVEMRGRNHGVRRVGYGGEQ